MRKVFLAAVALFAMVAPAAADQCMHIDDPAGAVARARQALESGKIKGHALEGAEAQAFAKEAGMAVAVRGIVIADTDEGTQLFVLFDVPNAAGSFLCFGAPTPKARAAILKHFGGVGI